MGNAASAGVPPTVRAVHPHVHGERNIGPMDSSPMDGSSPRAWGTLEELLPVLRQRRFIPTCMGNALIAWPFSNRSAVHPHVHGERPQKIAAGELGYGSSPRAWGTPALDSAGLPLRRFIPTCMGNARGSKVCCTAVPVHPHVHGERPVGAEGAEVQHGSSPRAWGTPMPTAVDVGVARFIPTCMGNAHPFLFQKGGRLLPPIQTQDQRFVMRNLGIA